MASTTRVLILEDHQLLGQALRVALELEGLAVELADLDALADVLVAVAVSPVDVVLLDLDLGAGRDGAGLVAPLAETGAKVVVVSGSLDRMRLASCLEQGAAGIVAKSTAFEDLLRAVRLVLAGEPLLSESRRLDEIAALRAWREERWRETAALRSLTPREREVLTLLSQGLTASAIATQSFVSEATVRTQIRAVLTKLGTRNQLAAVAEARRLGWTPTAGTPLPIG